MAKFSENLIILGWREWAALPELKIEGIKAKIDTGARTSSLHAENIEIFEKSEKEWVKFSVDPVQNSSENRVSCCVELFEEREVKSSTGHIEMRPVIITDLHIGHRTWPIEITLTNRDSMGFRMLLGREALRNRCLVNPEKSFLIKEG